jgi:dTDP-4-amino-4,6-dideoxygalactose transaminase
MIDYENLEKVNARFVSEFQVEFQEFLRSGWYVLGRSVDEFERAWAEYCGTGYAVGVANGLDALVLALRALELPMGAEVLVPSNTYIATILAVIQAGLKPILVEPSLRTYNLDPQRLPGAITKATRAILVVHLYGKLCEMEAISAFAKTHNLKVVEDCAQAHGAHFKGKKAGAWGDISAHSFYPTKNLGALGDAGGLTSNDEHLIDLARLMRNYGSRVKYYNEVVGVNSRLDELQARFLTVKLQALDAINSHKRSLARIYHGEIPGTYVTPSVEDGFFDVYHIFNIRHPDRDRLRAYLLDRGIKTEVHYPVPPHRQVAMRGILSGEYPISEEIHSTTLSLPISSFHTEEAVRSVCRALRDF